MTPAADGTRLFRLSIAHGLLATAIVLFCPLLALLVLPLIFGVAHVIGDVRWLIIREGSLSRAWAVILVPLGVMTALRLMWLAGRPWDPHAEMFLGATAVVGGALSSNAGSAARQIACVAAAVVLGWLAVQDPQTAAMVFAHGHNAVALGFFLFWSHKALGPTRVGLLASALLLVLSALFAGVLPVRDDVPVSGFDFTSAASTLAPGAGPGIGRGAVLSFVLLQALHYSVWLHLVPAARGGRSARDDLGRWLLVGAALAVAVALAGIAEPVRVRGAYLAVATFHGWLELAIAAHLISGSRPSP